MKPFLLTAMACTIFLTAVLIHEHREDQRATKLAGKLEVGLFGIEQAIKP